jgi:predicted ABC-type sugar transport system permease subunit
LLNSLAAIVVGGTSLSGGVGGPHRTLLGVLIIAILDNGLNLLGVSAYPQLVIKGGGGDRGCAGEPEPATKRVNQIILNS